MELGLGRRVLEESPVRGIARKVSRGKGAEITEKTCTAATSTKAVEHTNAVAGILGKGKSCKGD